MKKTFVMASMITAVGMMGCSKPQPTPETPNPEASAPIAEADSAPQTKTCQNPSTVEIDADTWADANNTFGLKLLAAQKGTAVVSPYSAERVLGMTLDGACGDTASEMRTALSLPDAKNLSEAGSLLEQAMLENTDKIELSIDYRIWTKINLKDAYQTSIKANYGIEPTTLDFAADPEKARTTINDDIAKSTQNRIQNLLAPGSITSLTSTVLTNAVYFKAPWDKAFKAQNTQKADFYGLDGTTQVDMMHHTAQHFAFENDHYTAFTMDFKNANYSFMVILPKESRAEALANVESNLSAASIREILNQFAPFDVALSMPKFRIDTTTMLTDILKNLGMKKAFGEADFSSMTDADVRISEVVQKAFLEVSEEGAEAAAATGVVMQLRMAPPRLKSMTINVDHPFLYGIIERSTGTLLFVGRVTTL